MSVLKQTYPVKGMTCAACARSVENMLKFTEGVESASVNYASAEVQVHYNTETTTFSDMQKAVQAIGYDLVEEIDTEKIKAERLVELKKMQTKFWVAFTFSVPVFLLSMVFVHVKHSAWLMLLLSIPVIFYSGSHFYISAFKKIKHAQFNMDTLIALGTGSAFLFSLFNTFYPEGLINAGLQPHLYYESSVVIITLILLGNFLEEIAKSKTGAAIEELMGLQAKEAIVVTNGEEKATPIEKIRAGDLIKIFPGSKIPVDGIVKKGSTYVDESMLTGESMAVKKNVGDKLTAGTINQSGNVVLETQRTGNGTVLAQIIQLIHDAQNSKAPAQKLADKISSIFVPLVISFATIAFFIWYFIGPEPVFTNAFVVFITVLIIACPCALGLATPTAITVGIGKGAKSGILIKNAAAIEIANKMQVLLVDKTGTLTQGKPEVSATYFAPNEDQEELKSIFYHLEILSEHPLSQAIISCFNTSDKSQIEVKEFYSKAGIGIFGKVENDKWFAGKPSRVLEQDWYISALRELKKAGATIVELQREEQPVALLGLTDVIKPQAQKSVSNLQKRGVEVMILTGDNEENARLVADELNIKKYRAHLLPADKLKAVKEFQEKGKIVAMVGDGINDAPALTQADIGIAMGGGTDIAMESADITLLHGDISKVEAAIELSKRITTAIRQNLFWAFFYNILAIPIAAGVLFPLNGFLLNPMIAGGAMAFSSVTVVLNSLRLKWR